MTVRELVTRLGFKTDDRGFRKGDAQFATLRRAALATAAAAVGVGTAMIGMARSVATAGDEIAKTAPTTGLGARAFQGYRFAADRAGVANTQFATGMQLFRRSIGDAANGIGEAKDVFEQLGISVRDSNGDVRDVASVLRDTIDAFEGMENSALRGAAAQRLFGRSGQRMGEFLRTGNAEIDALIAEFEALGGVLEDDILGQSEEFEDRLTDLKVVVMGLKNAVGVALIPSLVRLLGQLTDWWRANNAIIRQNLGAVVRGIAGAVATAARIANGAAQAFGGWANSAELLAIAIGGSALLKTLRVLLPIIKALRIASLGLALAFGLKAAAVLLALLAIQDFFAFLRGDESVLGKFVDLAERGVKALREFADIRGKIGAFGAFLVNPLGTAVQAAGAGGGSFDPSVIGTTGGGGSRSVTVNNDVKLEVPPGTTEQQRAAIQEAGESMFSALGDRLGRMILNEASETD